MFEDTVSTSNTVALNGLIVLWFAGLAEIFIEGEEKSLNELLIENGHAYVYEGGKKQIFKG